MTARRTKLLIALLAVVALVAGACSDSDDTPTVDAGVPGDEDRTLTIYSGRNEELILPVIEDFETATGIDVDVRYGDSADLALLIEEEGDDTPADVFLSQSPGSVGFLQANGHLATLPDEVLDLVPAAVRDPGGQWVGFSGRQRVLVVNPDLVDEADLPESVFDLTDPVYEGRIGVAPSNGSFQDFVTAMRAASGDDVTEEFLTGLAANDPLTYPKNSAITAAVGRGEIEMGLVNHYYALEALADDPTLPVRNHYFAADDPGSVFIVTGAAVLQGSDDADLGQRFIEYLLSESAQEFFTLDEFEYPVVAGIEASPEVEPIDFATFEPIDFSVLGGGLTATREMIADAGFQG